MNIAKLAKKLPRPIRTAGNRILGARTRRQGGGARDELARRIADSPFFDYEYYAAQRGNIFVSPLDAAYDWLRRGARKGYGLHPLVEPGYFPRHVHDALARRQFDGFARWLTDERNQHKPWSPVFDPSGLAASDETFDVEAFFRGLTDDQQLPVPPGFQGPAPTWASIRESAIEHANHARRQVDVAAPGKYGEWDTVREQEWLAQAQALPASDETLVSVIMPVWNREATMSTAIASVVAQTHRAWELVIVDDGSTDGSVEVAEGLASSEPRIRVVRLEHGGVSKARNAGLHAATGDVVAFLDSDNEWTARHLELSVRWLAAHPDVAATHSGMRIWEADGSTSFRGADVGVEGLAKRSLIDMNALVARRSVALARGGFDERLARWVDYALLLDIAEQGELAFLPFVGCEYSDLDAPDRITKRESNHWEFVAASRHVVRWEALATRREERVRGRVSIVMLVFQEYAKTIEAIDRVLATTEGGDVELILVDNSSQLTVGRVISARYHAHPRVTYRRLTRNYNFATGCNVGFSISSGEYVLFLNNDTEVRDGWLAPLVSRLEGTDAIGVQPLMLYPNGSVQTAGTIFVLDHGLPIHFLSRYPREDALRHPGKGFRAVTAGALLMRAGLFEDLRGFDPIYANGYEDVDLCLRAHELTGGYFEVESSSVVGHEESKSPGRFANSVENRRIFLERWRDKLPTGDEDKFKEIGLAVPHLRPLPGGQNWTPVVTRPQREVTVAGFGTIPSLRWAIKIGSIGTHKGDWWGDTAFANDLRTALEALGQEVVIDRHGAFSRETSYLDDVVLTIRGLDAPEPQAGRVNILWVISHPELVTVAEIEGQDLVYAASEAWASEMRKESGREVGVLLQATNPQRFDRRGPSATEPADVLFVGVSRLGRGGRPLVEMAIDAGADISLWGPGWDTVAPEHARGEFLDFELTPAAYASSNIVLNDHLDVMREGGFVSNRTFDAVVSGAAVITDDIEGLEVFDGAVVACSSTDQMRSLLADRSWIPAADRFEEISDRIAKEHSFDARARTLLTDVLARRG